MTTLYSDEALYTVLCKYLLSEADAEEHLWVEEWLRADPQHPELLASLKKVLGAIPGKVDPAVTEVAWQRLSAKIGTGKRSSWWMAAAIFLLAAGAGLWYMAARGGRTQLFTGPVMANLQDGTTIELDSFAQLEVMPGFGNRQRLVKLKGKAVFNVTKDAAHPFIVRLEQREVRVLGTRFMINYQGNDLLVHVDSGSVMVDSVVLSTGMMLAQHAGETRVATHVVNPDKRELVFSDTPLHEVLQTISVLYNIKVAGDSALLDLPVTATFTGESAINVLETIAYMTNASIVKGASGIELKKHEE